MTATSSRPGLVRRALVAFFRVVLRIFFRRIEVYGLDRVPREGPAIFVLNHPNALVDPLFILCLAPRPVSFLAKSTIFRMPVIGWLARAFGSIPVHRHQDVATGGADPAKNRETFDRARALLTAGGSLALFPEGVSHSAPALRPIKTGAARIALGAASDGTRIEIVPAGLYYTAKATFRSDALLCFGAPLEVPRAELDAGGEPPRDAVQALSAEIERALRDVTLNADEASALALVARAERIFSAGGERALAGELDFRRRFVAGHAYWRERDPARLAAIETRVARYERELEEAGLDPDDLDRPSRVGPHLALRLLAALVALPLAAAGALVHYPAYRLVGAIARRVAKGDDDMVATVKMLAGLLLFPLTWVALGIFAAWWAALAAPIAGWVALRVFEEWDTLAGEARALLYFTARRRFFENLVRERAAIRDELARMGEEARV